ncbi:GntR family transcriptional regulator [Jiella mangrovi]|uniref:GntR family transcriptional regulator n=1 Tax=Jiella mangrovi TaxID=2821407 RepID=A0ABS4BKH4_9HYPH|nr:GntR family transcriptional regulator [Jiella mangrovi]MBP0616669.1 GntR family transcriptional regulator [Jiella mangrovi]
MIEFDQELSLRSIGSEVADRIEAAIVREIFAPGEKLREIEICSRFGISRSPLREAFQILEGRGLVERRPRLGTRVTELSVGNLDEITACRIPLEATCSRLIAERPDRENVARELTLELEAMRDAKASGDFRAGFEANVRMTALSHARCGNAVLMRLLDQLDKAALRYRFRAYRSTTGILDDMIEGNAAMIAEIRAGRASEAAAVTAGLVERAWHTSRRLFLEAAEGHSAL